MNASRPPQQRSSLTRADVFPDTFPHWFRFPKAHSSSTAGPGEKANGVDGVADRRCGPDGCPAHGCRAQGWATGLMGWAIGARAGAGPGRRAGRGGRGRPGRGSAGRRWWRRLGVGADLVDDLRRRARQAVLAQVGQLTADRGGAAGELGLVLAAAHDLGGGEDHRRRVAALGGAGLPHPVERRGRVRRGPEGRVELVGVSRGQGRGPARAAAADDHRDLRPLDRLGQRGRVGERSSTRRRRRTSGRPEWTTGR